MFFKYTEITVRHFFCIFKTTFCGTNFKWKGTNVTPGFFPINRVFYFICFFASILNSKLLILIFLLNHPNKQSEANFSSVENISDIANELLFCNLLIVKALHGFLKATVHELNDLSLLISRLNAQNFFR